MRENRLEKAWTLLEAAVAEGASTAGSQLLGESMRELISFCRAADPCANACVDDAGALRIFLSAVKPELAGGLKPPVHVPGHSTDEFNLIVRALPQALTAAQRWSDGQASYPKLRRAVGILVGMALAVAFFALPVWGPPVLRRTFDEGLRVVYHRGTGFGDVICERLELEAAKWYDGSRRDALGREFSARWRGVLLVPETAEYTFHTRSIDGIRLMIDGRMLIDNWARQRWWRGSGRHASMPLAAGRHSIRIEHFVEGEQGAFRVRWAGGPIPRDTPLAAPFLQRN